MNKNDIIKGYKEIVKPPSNDLNESEIEAKRKRYWKCVKCNELNEIKEKMCYKCYSDRPQNPVHPSAEEIRKMLKNEESSVPFWFGMALIVAAGIIFIRGYVRHGGVESHDIVFTVIAALAGVLLLLYSGYRKIKSSMF